MKKQTAFQYYIQQHNIIANSSDNISLAEKFKLFDEIIQKTKQMEKEQIKEAYWNGSDGDEPKTEILKVAENYYNETYGGNK